MKSTKKILSVFIIWRLSLFFISYISDVFLLYQPSFPYAFTMLAKTGLFKWIFSWANFDGVHYLTIVNKSYVGTGLIQAFFPFYPILIKVVSLTGIHPLISGLAVSNLSFLSLIIVWYKLIKEKFSSKTAWLSILVLLTFPTSFFFGALYTESLFLFFIVSSFYFADKRNWLLAGVLASFASATRIVGIFLLPALFIQFLFRNHISLSNFYTKLFKIESLKKIFFILLGSMGLLAYMYYLYITFKDPLYFYHVQSEFGGGREESLVLYPQVVWRYIKILATASWDLKFLSYVQEFVAGTVGLVLLLLPLVSKLKRDSSTLVGMRKIPIGWLVFSWGAFFIPTLTGTFSSMGRYILVCFPLFIIIAQLLENSKKGQIIYLILSTLLLIINTLLFIQGYWVA